MAAAISLKGPLLFVLLAPAPAVPEGPASPPTSDEAILAEPKRQKRFLRFEEVRARMTFFDQYGRGWQSKAGPPQGPGSERLIVWQPALAVGLRHRDERFSHWLSGVVDIVSSASVNALDAVSSASRENEAGTFDNTSSFEPNARDKWSIRYGLHLEEPWRSGFGGIAYAGDFNEGNTTFATSVNFIYDYFDDLHPRGWNVRQAQRYTLNDNLSIVQVLSPTTLAVVSYGLTFQTGTLENGWNSVYISDAQTYGCWDDPTQAQPYDCPNRQRDRWPRTRTRHAIAGQLNQHVPRTRSTFKAGYRYYRDDFQLEAHTVEAFYYQWMGRRFYLRLGYRLHAQSGVGFYTRSIVEREIEDRFYTADSDLARFIAHQPSVKGVVYITPPGSAKGGAQFLDLGYARYQRSNDLRMNIFSLGYGKSSSLLMLVLLACRPAVEGTHGGPEAVMEPVPLPPAEGLQRLTADAELEALVDGKVAVIDFWATWCEPCRDSIPKIVRLADAYAQEDLVVIGIHVGTGVESAERFAAEARIRYPLYADPELAFSDRVGSQSVPTLLVVDRRGRIVRRGTELDAPALALVRTLLAE